MNAPLSPSTVSRLDGSWLFRTCSRRCHVQGLLIGVLAALAILAVASFGNSQIGELSGPHRVDAATLLAAKSVSALPHRYVRIDCDEGLETGLSWVEDGEHTPLWAVPVGERFLIVRSAARPKGTFSGTAEKMDWSLQRQFDDVSRRQLLPYFLKESDPRVGIVVFLLILVALAAVLVGFTVRALRRALDPSRHPAIRRLAETGWLELDAPDVGDELAAPDVTRYRGWALTQSFLVAQRPWRFDVRALADLVWAHKLRTSHRLYLVIPAGSTYDPVLHFADGKRLVLKAPMSFGRTASEAGVDEFLQSASERAPWALFGFTEEIRSAWLRDRDALCAEVARRRAETLRGA